MVTPRAFSRLHPCQPVVSSLPLLSLRSVSYVSRTGMRSLSWLARITTSYVPCTALRYASRAVSTSTPFSCLFQSLTVLSHLIAQCSVDDLDATVSCPLGSLCLGSAVRNTVVAVCGGASVNCDVSEFSDWGKVRNSCHPLRCKGGSTSFHHLLGEKKRVNESLMFGSTRRRKTVMGGEVNILIVDDDGNSGGHACC